MLKNAANRPEKNISSEASHTMTPTWTRAGRYDAGSTRLIAVSGAGAAGCRDRSHWPYF